MGCNVSVQPITIEEINQNNIEINKNRDITKILDSEKELTKNDNKITNQNSKNKINEKNTPKFDEQYIYIDGNVKYCKSKINNYDVYYPPLGSGATSYY